MGQGEGGDGACGEEGEEVAEKGGIFGQQRACHVSSEAIFLPKTFRAFVCIVAEAHRQVEEGGVDAGDLTALVHEAHDRLGGQITASQAIA